MRRVIGSSIPDVSVTDSMSLSATGCGVSKTVMCLIGPSRVRIPPPPLSLAKSLLGGDFSTARQADPRATVERNTSAVSRKSPCAGAPDDRNA